MGNGRTRHGAVIVKGGSLQSVGYNKSRTHNMWVQDRDRSDCSIHAEVAAIRGCSVSGATLYVVRVNASGELRMSKPCSSCQTAIVDSDMIRKVVHS